MSKGPENPCVMSKRPENPCVMSKRPENSCLMSKRPENTHVAFQILRAEGHHHNLHMGEYETSINTHDVEGSLRSTFYSVHDL